jgi:hypothetical protein
MTIVDKCKPHTVFLGSLKYGEIFAITDEDDVNNKFYLIKIQGENQVVVLGERNGEEYRVGEIWTLSEETEVEPLRADLTIWNK